MTINEQRINEAIETEGPGSTVTEMFAPFLTLLRDFAAQRDIAGFSMACARMAQSARHNRNVVLHDDAPKILTAVYLPQLIPTQLWPSLQSSGKVSAWQDLLAPALPKPEKLHFLLAAFVAEAEKQGAA
ncbi:hypothetical protein ACOTJQ_29340 [Achromobacter xylosoxidans]|uniref:hypothetical protein n=1 Tax=Achromobacter ruhlandii TaxID=72557 RepID=UPI003B993B13